MNKLVSQNPIQRFQQGKRFRLASSDNKIIKEFNTEEQAKTYRKQNNIVGRITDQNTSAAGSVIKADRTKGKDSRATSYGRQQAEKYNNLSFKQAYQEGRKTRNKYFAYKGKVYKTDLQNGKDNMTDMQMLYGTHLGYSNDPKLQTKQSRAAREQYRKDVNTSEISHTKEIKKSQVPYSSAYDGGELFSNVMGLISPTRWVGAVGRASRGEGKGNFVSKVFSNMLDPQNGARENQGIFSLGLASANEQWAAEHPTISGLTNGVLDAFVYGPKPRFTKEFKSMPRYGYRGRKFVTTTEEVPMAVYEGNLNISPGTTLGTKPYIELGKQIGETTKTVTRKTMTNPGTRYVKYMYDKPTGNYSFSWSEGMKDMFPGVTAVTANNIIKGSN